MCGHFYIFSEIYYFYYEASLHRQFISATSNREFLAVLLKKDENNKNFDLTKDEKANRFDLTKDEKPKQENVPVKAESPKRVNDIDKVIKEAGKKQEQDKKDGLRKEKSQEIEK